MVLMSAFFSSCAPRYEHAHSDSFAAQVIAQTTARRHSSRHPQVDHSQLLAPDAEVRHQVVIARFVLAKHVAQQAGALAEQHA